MQSTLMQRGKFITFEGSEGCGKSTQIALFVDFLARRGIPFLQTREPGGTPVGEKIRHLLQFDPESEDLCDESELLLFAASRSQLVRRVIEPALASGTWVVADRFLDSTTVYQGVGRGLELESVEQVNRFAVGGAVPDLTLLLDLDPAEGHRRAVGSAGDGGDRMERLPLAFFERVREGYLSLAEADPGRIMVVDAGQSVETVASRIQSILAERFGLSPL